MSALSSGGSLLARPLAFVPICTRTCGFADCGYDRRRHRAEPPSTVASRTRLGARPRYRSRRRSSAKLVGLISIGQGRRRGAGQTFRQCRRIHELKPGVQAHDNPRRSALIASRNCVTGAERPHARSACAAQLPPWIFLHSSHKTATVSVRLSVIRFTSVRLNPQLSRSSGGPTSRSV